MRREKGEGKWPSPPPINLLAHLATYIREHDSFGGITTLQSSTYIKTLARWARTVYPFDWPSMMVER
jgi:hypothetical protein